MTSTNKRRDSRFALQRRVKLLCPATGRCYAGRTSDYSAGGALLVMDGPSQLSPGEPVKVGLDWTGRQGLIKSEMMPKACIVRSMTHADKQHVAIAFEERQLLAASA